MEFNRSLDLVRAKLPPGHVQAELAAGRNMSLEQAVDYALKLPFRAGAVSEAESLHPEPANSLTGRGREIAGLIAQGKTNTAIAAELFISKRTVGTHASHIMSKLGLSGRAKIIRWAMDHELTGNSR